jgi:hypothetical protein
MRYQRPGQAPAGCSTEPPLRRDRMRLRYVLVEFRPRPETRRAPGKGWIRIWEPRLATHTTDVGCDPAALAHGWHLRACDHEQGASTRILVAPAIWPLAAHGCTVGQTVGQSPRTVANIRDRAHAPDATLVRIPRRRFCPDTEEVTGSNPVSPTVTPLVRQAFARVWCWDQLTCRPSFVGLSLAVATEDLVDGGRPAGGAAAKG